MKELKEILYVIIAVAAGLLVLYWLGQGMAWIKISNDDQRMNCVNVTHDYPYCEKIW